MSENIAAYLKRSARVLADCADLLIQIEDGVAPLIARAPDRPAGDGTLQTGMGSPAVSLQSIDLLSQTLADMALWLEGLATEVQLNPPPALDASAALARLRLADVRHRLQGLAVTADAPLPEPLLF